MNHIHVSALSAITMFLMVGIVGFFWRVLALKLSDSPVGKAMMLFY